MTKSKWIRRALLGGVALAVMASGAQAADDLDALKAQIEALQARVNAIESKGVTLPEGVSLITFQRGHEEIALAGDDTKALDKAGASRGFTIAITPTADLPAPATEITISGAVRNVAVWGKVKDTIGGSFKDADFDMESRGTVNIRSKTDTAIGQVRTHVQIRAAFGNLNIGDRILGGSDPSATTPSVQARLAYGELDFMPGWTLLAGHAGQIAAITNAGYGTIFVPLGVDSTRHNQIRITYSGGPITFGMGIENPSQDDWGGVLNTTVVPDFAGFMQFNAPANISLRVTGEVSQVGNGIWWNPDTDTGYLLGAGASLGLGMFTLKTAFVYTKGLGCDGIFNAGPASQCRNAALQLMKGYGLQVNAGMSLTDTVSANASFGYFNYTNELPGDWDKGYSVHGNLVWRPVDAFQVGAEAGYYHVEPVGNGKVTVFAGGVAFWFFF